MRAYIARGTAACGAEGADLFRLVVRSGGKPVVAGLIAGLALAAGASFAMWRVLRTAPIPMQPAGPAVFAAAVGILQEAALPALAVPARRAASADPVAALRQD